MPKSRLRLIFAMIMLVISLIVLAWSFLPGERLVRRQKILPTEMQLPTPLGYTPCPPSIALLRNSLQAGSTILVDEFFV